MVRNNPYSPMYLLSQRGEQGGGYEQSCHKIENDDALPLTLGHSIEFNPMNIKIRYAYDDVTYPVTYIYFNPQAVNKAFQCIKY